MGKCVLEIRDEVNVRFQGLDVKTRRKISDEVKYFLPYAYHMPSYKLGRWDGCIRYCDIGGRTYFHLLDKLLPIVTEDGYEIEVKDARKNWNFSFTNVTKDSYQHVVWPKKHPAEGEPIILRDYQVDIVNKFFDTNNKTIPSLYSTIDLINKNILMKCTADQENKVYKFVKGNNSNEVYEYYNKYL